MDPINNILRILLIAQRCAHVHHWQAKSFSKHVALGELYEALTKFADELAEIWMGASGETVAPEQSDPNGFSQQDPVEFIRHLNIVLAELRGTIPAIQGGELPFVNRYDELCAVVQRTKYKLEKLA
jgi:hypothetical protein